MTRLIDADNLKHKFAQITYARFTADMGQGGFEMFSEKEIENIIDNAPTVTDRTKEVLSLQNTIAKLVDGIAENTRPKGEWIKIDEEWYDYKCSICGEKVSRLYPFCHCGADMRKGGAKND